MRAAGLLVIIMFATLPALAQSDTEPAPVIPVHPDVPTVVRLPEDIERAWITDSRELKIQGLRSKLYIRPRPGTPAGVEAIVEVQTRSLHRIFQVLVVERVEDAVREVVVPAVMVPAPAEEPGDEAASVADTSEEPAAREENEPSPAPVEPEPAGAVDTEPTAAAPDLPRFDLSVHAVLTPAGITALDYAGYAPVKGRRIHRAVGLRLAAAPRGAWWSVEAGITGEQLDTPTVHLQTRRVNVRNREQRVSGPWLRWDVGLRARLGTRWIPTTYLGVGLQAHLRNIERISVEESERPRLSSTEDMPYGAVLALGLGLQYQTRGVLLGVDFQIRQGVPAEYRSVAMLLSVGYFLEKEMTP